MKKLLIFVLLTIFGNNLFAMNWIKEQTTKKEKAKIINDNRQELLKIVQPELESVMAGAKMDEKLLIKLPSSIGSTVSKITNYENIKKYGLKSLLKFATSEMLSIACSRCCKYIIVGSNHNNIARVYCLKDLNNITYIELKGHSNVINSVAISACGKYAITGSSDSTTRVWDISDLKNIKSSSINIGFPVTSVAISKCGKFAVMGCLDGTAAYCDLSDLTKILNIPLLGHTDRIVSIAISEDNNYIVTASDDKTARLWYFNESNTFTYSELKGHTDYITAVAFSRTGKLVTASIDGTLIVWDISDLKNIKSNHKYPRIATTTIAISDSNKYIITSSFILDIDNNNRVRFTNSFASSIALSNSSIFFAKDNTIKVLNLSTWIIDQLDLLQLQILEKLINANPETALDFYEINIYKFSENMQHYIERYLYNRLIEYYLTLDKQVSGSDIRQIVYDYLGQQNVKASIKANVQASKSITDKNQRSLEICSNCKKDNCTLRCAKCQLAYYCSKECQKSHWTTHRDFCIK